MKEDRRNSEGSLLYIFRKRSLGRSSGVWSPTKGEREVVYSGVRRKNMLTRKLALTSEVKE